LVEEIGPSVLGGDTSMLRALSSTPSLIIPILR
jgi:hypothetical protein